MTHEPSEPEEEYEEFEESVTGYISLEGPPGPEAILLYGPNHEPLIINTPRRIGYAER